MRVSCSLSINAERLLRYLQNFAVGRDRACTHARIAAALRIPQRIVSDLAGELLDAGHLAIAETGSPPGLWLLPKHPTDTELEAARHYLDSLRARAVEILKRRRAVKRAIETVEAGRRREPSGQFRLFVAQGA